MIDKKELERRVKERVEIEKRGVERIVLITILNFSTNEKLAILTTSFFYSCSVFSFLLADTIIYPFLE